jgi:hypothetical protein
MNDMDADLQARIDHRSARIILRAARRIRGEDLLCMMLTVDQAKDFDMDD